MSTNVETVSIWEYFRGMYEGMSSTFKGMWITFKYVWGHKPVTIEYPEVREVIPSNARMRLFNDADNCIACNMCAIVCPVDCIYITSEKRDGEIPKTDDGTAMRQDMSQYVIDTALCCYCGLCTTVCPTESLKHSNDYEFAQYTLNDMKYDYLSEEVRAWRPRLIGKEPVYRNHVHKD
jgi:NADH-quinone oxidoreductase subunit I